MFARLLLIALLAATLATPSSGQEQSRPTFEKLLGDIGVRKIVEFETNAFVQNFGAMTGRKFRIADDYLPAVVDPILTIEIPAEQSRLAEDFLRARYGKFIGSLTAYTLATESQKTEVLSKAQVVKYLDIAGKVGRCGEYPCRKGCDRGGCTLTCAACSNAK